MNYTNQIIKTFGEINEKISDLTKGDSQLCDYDTFQEMMEMWIIPDHSDTPEIEQFMSDFQAYLQYKFEDELEDILYDLKMVAQYVEKKTAEYKSMSNNEILSDLLNLSASFQNRCEHMLDNIRLKINEEKSFVNLEI